MDIAKLKRLANTSKWRGEWFVNKETKALYFLHIADSHLQDENGDYVVGHHHLHNLISVKDYLKNHEIPIKG